MSWSISQAKHLYSVSHWSDGYFDIDEQGHLMVLPNGPGDLTIVMDDLVEQAKATGLSLPILFRFNDILKNRLFRLRSAFDEAIGQVGYSGGYTAIYPIKVNQQRRVVTELLTDEQAHAGLEAGSKPELLTVLAQQPNAGMTVICNGYKDREYLRLALIGQQLGHRVFIIIEKSSELDRVLEIADKMGITPNLGVRVRLASLGVGQWQNTGGVRSKFGLSASQVLALVDRLDELDKLDCLQLLHCHMGSQIANIRDIQRGLKECARFYAALRDLGVPIQIVDVGGGLGVDYEGSRSRHYHSMNYTLQEYANNVVNAFHEVCLEMELSEPDLMTESGRALTAHHAVLVTDVIERESILPEDLNAPDEESHRVLVDLWNALQSLEEKSLVESYHDACHYLSEAQSLYLHGVIDLAERAYAEQLYQNICLWLRDRLEPTNHAHRSILDELEEELADKYVANFSVFQSTPDVWAIDQIFPVMPLSSLDQPPSHRVVIHDMTCDSDGRIDRYVDSGGVSTTLLLPTYHTSRPYLLGLFLVGAYQEILGDIHNLFGDTDSVHVALTEDGYELIDAECGDRVEDMMRVIHFDPAYMLSSYEQQLASSTLPSTDQAIYLAELEAGLSGYTYLED